MEVVTLIDRKDFPVYYSLYSKVDDLMSCSLYRVVTYSEVKVFRDLYFVYSFPHVSQPIFGVYEGSVVSGGSVDYPILYFHL